MGPGSRDSQPWPVAWAWADGMVRVEGELWTRRRGVPTDEPADEQTDGQYGDPGLTAALTDPARGAEPAGGRPR